MKNLVYCLILLSFSSQCFSQDYRKINDPVFYLSAAKNIEYPTGAIRASVYGRFYAAFRIDSLGKIHDIQVIYPILNDEVGKLLGFEAEIKTGLGKTPRLLNVPQGKYVLPIAFTYSNVYYGTEDYPTNRIPEKYLLENYQFLEEIKISARSDRYRGLRGFSNIPPPSRQVVDF